MSGINSLLLHVAVITPVCQYLLTSPKFPRPRNFIFAAFFLAAVALAGEASEWSSRPSNHYRVLGVSRSSSGAELKAAFRSVSLKFHPDKNKAPEAVSIFQSAQEAYETLSDAETRRVYDRWGPEVAKDPRLRAQAARGDGEMMHLAGFYVSWAVLTYLMTLGKARASGRTWSFVGLIVCAFLEFQMLTQSWEPLQFLSMTTPFEKVALLRAVYPSFMHGCILLSQFTYVDLESLQLQLLGAVLASNEALQRQLAHVLLCVDRKGGAAVLQDQASADGGRGAEGLSVAQRMARSHAAQQRVAEAQQQKQKGGFPSWMVMVGLYVLFNYVLK